MKSRISILLCIIILTGTLNCYSKSHKTIERGTDEFRTEIEAINTRTEQLYITENINLLTDLYTEHLTFFPEYKRAIFDKEKLKKFFIDWFRTGDVKAYRKDIYTVEVYSDHVLEIGAFNMSYSSVHHSEGAYKGKYMILWKRDEEGKLNIVSETFSADSYIDPEAVPYASVQVKESNSVSALHNINRELLHEIEAFNAVVLKAVAEGDGDARARGFTNDAILLSNSDSMRVGMDAIRTKMLKTYTPDISFQVKHTYNRIYDLGDYVFVNGHYKGEWGDSARGGKFEGNMSSLMKKTESGNLLMHRQLDNREG